MSSTDEFDYIVDGTGADGKFVPGIDDLSSNLKKTLGDYLSALSSDGKNSFPIDAGSTAISILDSAGNPAAIGGTPANSSYFVGDLENWVSNFLDSKSSQKTADYLSKGLPERTNTVDGHQLLSEIVGNTTLKEGMYGVASSQDDGATPMLKQVSQVLRTNRFNPTPGNSPYVENGRTPSVGGQFRTNMGTSVGGSTLSVEEMQKVGASLLLMGAGGDGTVDPDTSAGLFLGAGVQLGSTRIPQNALDVRLTQPMRSLSRVSLESDLSLDGGDPEHFSYGHVNSPAAPFDGFVPLGMISLGALMTTTMIIGAEVIFSLLALITSTDGKSVRMDPGPYIVGEYGRPEADGLLSVLIGPKALGLIHTENDYFDAAKRGANVFFGFSGDNLSQATETALLNIIQAPGYYVTVVRTILRSLNTISNSLKNVNFSNPIAGAQAVLGVVEVIKSSKIIAFFNACAALGDIAINEELRGVSVVPGQKNSRSIVDDLEDRISSADKLPQGVSQRPGMSVMKSRSRAGSNSLSLAWRSSAAPAMYLLPKKVLNAGIDFGSNAGVAKGLLGGYNQDKFRSTESARLSTEDVHAMEDALEAEYVPFYFHDLRTNEIVSFHAFLKVLTDSYSPTWEQTDGYGRIDPVFTYKNTKRSIELSFIAAATSEEDFDEMWWKINKIVTLLYPQWGVGRQLTASSTGAKFLQPFSQVPTASPVLRLRIGDVVKSNFSKFNLARIFGLGDPSAFSPNSSFTSADFDLSKLSKIKNTLQTMITDPDLSGVPAEENGFAVGDLAILRATQGGFYTEGSATGGLLAQATAILSSGAARRKIKLTADIPVVITGRETKQLDKTKLNFNNSSKTIYTVEFQEDVPGISSEGITSVEVTHADLKIDPAYVLVKSEAFSAEDVETATSTDVSDFFSSQNNFVVRSFEAAGGRGLAGVITAMSFDWQTPTWDTTRGRRAPKSCEVTLSFSPIHDIAPGLDENGFNRAPLYNVGSTVESTVGDVYDHNVSELDVLVRQIYLKVAATLSRVKPGSGA